MGSQSCDISESIIGYHKNECSLTILSARSDMNNFHVIYYKPVKMLYFPIQEIIWDLVISGLFDGRKSQTFRIK